MEGVSKALKKLEERYHYCIGQKHKWAERASNVSKAYMALKYAQPRKRIRRPK